jgi:hypothetical protein
VILNRLASIESQQRVHTQILQAVLQASQHQELLEACELPEGITLPIETMSDLKALERKLVNAETKSLMVGIFHLSVNQCCIYSESAV